MSFWILILTLAFANGNRVGNGGKGIVCHKDGKTEIQILDLYENETPISKKLLGKKRDEVLSEVLKNLSRLASPLGTQYTRRSSSLMNEIEFKSGAELTATPDSFELSLPKESKCSLKQLAIRRLEKDDFTKEFLFAKDLWDQMPSEQQAALLLHEMIYEHFSKLGEKDSVKARKVTAHLMSEKAFEQTSPDFWKMIQSLKLPIYQ